MINNLLNIQTPINYFLILWVSIVIILLFLLFIITTLFISQKRINHNKKKIYNLKQSFDEELLKAKIEIQEQTFQEISSELHDNIGQVLSFIKLSLSMTENKSYLELENKLSNTKHLIDQIIIDIRNLQKTLSYQNIKNLGLLNTIKNEIDRINKDKILKIKINVNGEHEINNSEIELVIFRIFQESLNNILKHANAKNIILTLDFNLKYFHFKIQDDGIGFNETDVVLGSGLNNIVNRAKLIQADVKILSEPSKGTTIDLRIIYE